MEANALLTWKRRQLTEETKYISHIVLFIFTYDRNTSIMMRLKVNYLAIAMPIKVCLILNYLIIAPPILTCSTGWNFQASLT